MYLHIGREIVLKHDDIIGVFDIETSSVSRITREYLSKAQKNNRVVNVTDELPKSFVVCRDNNHSFMVYISQISSTTLLKRLNFLKDISLPDE